MCDFKNYAMLGLDGFLLNQIKKEPIMYDTLIRGNGFSLCIYGPQPWAWSVVTVELEINNLYSIRMIFFNQDSMRLVIYLYQLNH